MTMNVNERCEEPLVWLSGARVSTCTSKQRPECHLVRVNSVDWDGPVNVHFYQARGSCRAAALQMKPWRVDRYAPLRGSAPVS